MAQTEGQVALSLMEDIISIFGAHRVSDTVAVTALTGVLAVILHEMPIIKRNHVINEILNVVNGTDMERTR